MQITELIKDYVEKREKVNTPTSPEISCNEINNKLIDTYSQIEKECDQKIKELHEQSLISPLSENDIDILETYQSAKIKAQDIQNKLAAQSLGTKDLSEWNEIYIKLCKCMLKKML